MSTLQEMKEDLFAFEGLLIAATNAAYDCAAWEGSDSKEYNRLVEMSMAARKVVYDYVYNLRERLHERELQLKQRNLERVREADGRYQEEGIGRPIK